MPSARCVDCDELTTIIADKPSLPTDPVRYENEILYITKRQNDWFFLEHKRPDGTRCSGSGKKRT